MLKIDYDHIYDVLSSQEFLQKQGLGNELPFFICPYQPNDELKMQQCINRLKKELGQESPPVKFLHIDLYDLCIKMLEEEGIFGQVFEVEESASKSDIKELLQSVLDSERYLVPAIQKELKEAGDDVEVLLISGVGEVYPYIRSHNILNNLQTKEPEMLTVMFFPGDYKASEKTGTTLKLFNHLGDDQYYRAFNIYDFKI